MKKIELVPRDENYNYLLSPDYPFLMYDFMGFGHLIPWFLKALTTISGVQPQIASLYSILLHWASTISPHAFKKGNWFGPPTLVKWAKLK